MAGKRGRRASLSVIDFQALNFYQHELTGSVGRRKVPGISGLLGQCLGVQKTQPPGYRMEPPLGEKRGSMPPGEKAVKTECAEVPRGSHTGTEGADPGC